MSRSGRLTAWGVLVVFPLFAVTLSIAQVSCPDMPDKITQVNHNVRSDVQLGIGSLWKVKAGQLGVQTDVVAKNLFDKYPNADRVLIVQTMAATYCGMLRDSKTVKDAEKLRLWSEFSDRVFKFENPDYKPTPPSKSTTPPYHTRTETGSHQKDDASNVAVPPPHPQTQIRNWVDGNIFEYQPNTLAVEDPGTMFTNNTVRGMDAEVKRGAYADNNDFEGRGEPTQPPLENDGKGANQIKIWGAQIADILRCPMPCGPHGPFFDSPIEGLPSDLPLAKALHGSSLFVADQLSALIDEGYRIMYTFYSDNDVQGLKKKQIAWQSKMDAIDSNLDPLLVEALNHVKAPQWWSKGMTNRDQAGVEICSLMRVHIDLLIMYQNQLRGVGD